MSDNKVLYILSPTFGSYADHILGVMLIILGVMLITLGVTLIAFTLQTMKTWVYIKDEHCPHNTFFRRRLERLKKSHTIRFVHLRKVKVGM